MTVPDLLDEVTLARYPFLPQARSWIASMAAKHQIDIDELLDGSMMDRARIRARSRLVDSVDSDEGRLISRWAQAEAERAQRILERDPAIHVIANTYVSEIECDENGIWKMGLSDFIELCTGITGSRWRLPNCEISDGWVTLHDEGEKYSSRAKVARLSLIHISEPTRP